MYKPGRGSRRKSTSSPESHDESPAGTDITSSSAASPSEPGLSGGDLDAHDDKKRSRRCISEIGRVDRRVLRSTDAIDVVRQSIVAKYGQPLSHPELLVIAKFVSEYTGRAIDRDAMRRKNGLLAWCAEMLDDFMTVLAQTEGEKAESNKAPEDDGCHIDAAF